MYQFREDLKTYLNGQFSTDNSISSVKKPKLYNGYQVNHEPSKTQPEIQIQPLDNSEQVSFTTFCNKNANREPIQIAVYSGQLKIGNKEYSAQDASILLAEKIEQFMNAYIFNGTNDNIYQGRIISTSPALSMNETGSVYVTVMRFDFVVAYPYVAG